MLPSRRARSSDKSRDKNLTVKSRGPSRGWSHASPRKRPRPLRHRLRLPVRLARLLLETTKALPIWPSALKRRCASRPAKDAQLAARDARQPRPRRREPIHHRPPRRAIRAAASKDPQLQRPASRTRTKPPSTTRLNKKWRIYWAGRRRAEVSRRMTE